MRSSTPFTSAASSPEERSGKKLRGLHELHLVGLGNLLARDVSLVAIDSALERFVRPGRCGEPGVRDLHRVRAGRVRERAGARLRDRARHAGDAVVNDPAYFGRAVIAVGW